MSIMSYNGSGIVAMTGKNCVAIASDKRFGIQLQLISKEMSKIHKMHDKLYIGLAGLATDTQTLKQLLDFRLNLYRLHEDREIEPSTFANLLSALAYERRFGPYFVQPVVAGLSKDGVPFVDCQDTIGAGTEGQEPFVCAGTCEEQLYGMCEALYKPDLEPEDLFETISQCLLASVDRDAITGWGADVFVITQEGVVHKQLKCRQD
eukprot:169939_1